VLAGRHSSGEGQPREPSIRHTPLGCAGSVVTARVRPVVQRPVSGSQAVPLWASPQRASGSGPRRQSEARGRSAHSGLHLAEGRSALLAAARWCLEATTATAAMAAPDAAGGAGPSARPAVNVGRLVAGDASFVDDLAAAHAWLGTERQLNVVPDRAIAEGEARFSTTASGMEIARRLAALAATVGADTGTALAFEHGRMIPPVDPRGPQQNGLAELTARLNTKTLPALEQWLGNNLDRIRAGDLLQLEVNLSQLEASQYEALK